MSQHESSSFDPERETVDEQPNMNRDSGESYEKQGEREQTVHYVTPEQSMLRGKKLIPTRGTKSYSNWIATALFLLMILIGGLIWGVQGLREYHSNDTSPYYQQGGYEYHHHCGHHRHYYESDDDE